ncbi:hypothetical protein SeMB42_g01322 [Synchytrium endobioticum]|uniref:Uncharacterized protein n=1 Tax=Synchytrium endobioticum TaxID=286115 RepID=A0A507DD69_9FUNG|nr:hypothetical protein SeLEV6574_g01603 [Synchytrium endobioticum]TPX52554.1 hypothetical protein SeMB42_g01322 [Synchytrium endobioticum]
MWIVQQDIGPAVRSNHDTPSTLHINLQQHFAAASMNLFTFLTLVICIVVFYGYAEGVHPGDESVDIAMNDATAEHGHWPTVAETADDDADVALFRRHPRCPRYCRWETNPCYRPRSRCCRLCWYRVV